MTGKLWKGELARVLCEIGLIDGNYSGKLVINLNQGGVTEVEKVEKVVPEPGGEQVGGGRMAEIIGKAGESGSMGGGADGK